MRVLLILLSLSPCVAGCGRLLPQPEGLNIVLLLSDDQSAPDLGCYGNPHVRTPHLDRMAAEGLRFTRAYVASSQCSPSRASILTGQPPHTVAASRLHANVRATTGSIVELLRSAGYYTGAYRKVHQSDIQQRFDYYGDSEAPLAAFFDQRPKNRPFFLWFGSTDPHRPYPGGAAVPPQDPALVSVPEYLPDTPETRRDLADYYDEIHRFDRACGEILAILEQQGVAGNTMVVMTGDNGLPFPRAKATLYEAGIRVPLIVKWPGRIQPGRTSDALVSLMDLAATWLEAAGVPVPQEMNSVSLCNLLTGGDYQTREYIFSERNWHDNWDPIRAVVGERYKLIQNFRPEMPYRPSLDIEDSPSWESIQALRSRGALQGNLRWYLQPQRPQVEFYDLETDPVEWHNLADNPEHQERITEFQKVLSDWIRDTNDFLPPVHGAFPDAPRYRGVNPL